MNYIEKRDIRKEFFKLRIKHHSYNQCKKTLKAQFNYDITIRTLQRWTKIINETEWDLEDKSKRPKTIHYKINSDIENKMLLFQLLIY